MKASELRIGNWFYEFGIPKQADGRIIAYAAWRAAADAFRMYPDNKHTFSDYWETVK